MRISTRSGRSSRPPACCRWVGGSRCTATFGRRRPTFGRRSSWSTRRGSRFSGCRPRSAPGSITIRRTCWRFWRIRRTRRRRPGWASGLLWRVWRRPFRRRRGTPRVRRRRRRYPSRRSRLRPLYYLI
ncbi:MAG: hypothetical protein [Microviridae sp.]|nr:MAG: hypothetical protein [Microviridae sp.]